MKIKNIKSVLNVFLAIVFVLVITACGKAEDKPGVSTAASVAPAATETSATLEVKKDPVTLKVIMHADWAKGGPWAEIMKGYEAKSGNKVDLQIISDAFDQLVLTKIATKDLPDVLFYFSSSNAIKKLNPEKNLLELTNEPFMSRVNPTITKYYLNYQGKIYGIPTSGMNVSGVLYNKKVFADLAIAIPQTYDELMAAAEKIKAAGITPFYEAGKDGWPLQIFSFSGFANILNKQPDLMGKINTHKTTLDQIPEFVDLLQKQLDIVKKGYVNDNLFSGTYDLSLDQLATGKSAMVMNADWALPTLFTKYPDAEVGMFPQPFEAGSFVGVSDPQAAFVFKDTKNVAQAKELLEYLTEPETLIQYYNVAKTMPSWLGIESPLNAGTAELKPAVDAGKVAPFFNGLTEVPIGDFPKELQAMYGGNETPMEVAKNLQKNMDMAAKAAGIEGW